MSTPIYNIEDLPFKPGDRLKVKPYKTQSMNGEWWDGYMVGRECWVIGFGRSYNRKCKPNTPLSGFDEAQVVYMPEHGKECYTWVDIELLELVEVGKGRPPLIGIDTPLPEYYVEHTPVEDWLYRFRNFNQTYEGFTNAATYLADLSLRNDRIAMCSLPHLRRKDGSINPSKIAKLFSQRKLSVDEWALELPIDPLEGWVNSWLTRFKPKINWVEVAHNFKEVL